MRYYHVTDGEWHRPTLRGHRSQCCACGLVHRIDFRIRGKRVELRVYVDYRATAQVRRWRKVHEKKAA